MADLEVNTESVLSMQKTVADAVENLEQTLKAMYASVNELNAVWEGPNHKEFTESFQLRYEQMQKVNASLKVYQESVKKAGNLYGKCEEAAWQIVQGM